MSLQPMILLGVFHRLVFRSINVAFLCVLYAFSSFEVAVAAERSEIENASIQPPGIIEGKSSSADRDAESRAASISTTRTLEQTPTAGGGGGAEQEQFRTLEQTPTAGGGGGAEQTSSSTPEGKLVTNVVEFSPTGKGLGPTNVGQPAPV